MLTVRTPNEIALEIPEVELPDGTVLPARGVVRFPTQGGIHPAQVSIFPQKLVTGDFTRDTEQINSSHIFEDFTGGVGVLHMDETTQVDRFWDSTANTLFKNQLTLPWKAVDTGSGGSPSTAQARCSAVLSGALYVAFDNIVRAYNDNTSSWGTALVTLSATATSAIVFNGTMYFLYGSGIRSTTDGTTWAAADTTHQASYATVWDSRMWTIKTDGTFWVLDTLGTWTSKAKLGLAASEITGLGTFYASDNTEVIYAFTRTGPYVYDATNDKWLRGRFVMPRQRGSGIGHTVYRDALYMSAGLAVYQHTGGNVSPIGLDREWGLPGYLDGQITWLTSTPAWLIAVLDSTASSTAPVGEFEPATFTGWGSTTFRPTQGYSSVWAWNDKGWHNLWRSTLTGSGATWAALTDLFNETRLWIGANNRVYKIRLPDGTLNPLQVPNGIGYAESAEHITPWFDGEWSELDKLAIRLRVRTLGCSVTETVSVDYATNDSDTWRALGTITSNGEARFDYGDGLGEVVRNIRFRIRLARGSNDLLTPTVKYAVLAYEKVLEPKMGWTTTLHLTEPYDGRSVAEQIDCLEQALFVKTKLAMCFRDGLAQDQTRQVKISRVSGTLLGGDDWRGRYDLSLIEP